MEGSGGEFESVEGYVEFVLEEFLKEDEEEQVYSKEEEEEIEGFRLCLLIYVFAY
ncbi:MAG: hypothetical protein ACTSUS_03500 [Candidatus Freyarchaeota archaeon]